jgi:hypothetical protein
MFSSRHFVESQRRYPELAAYDVIVCGGGPSGYIAAIAAARAGMRTAIVEQLSFFGGMATAGLVAPISEFHKNGRRIIGGIPWEAMARLEQAGGADLSYPTGNVPYDPELYKAVIQDMILEAKVDPYLSCTVADCLQSEDTITHLICTSKHGGFALKGRYFIDCTGDAVLCQAAHVPFQPEPEKGEFQPATLCFRLGNVDTDHLENIHLSHPDTRYFNSRIKEILLSVPDKEQVPNFGGPWFCWALRDGIVNVNMTRARRSFSNPLEASRIACGLRRDSLRFVELLRKYVKEFENCYLMETATLVGYRESRRIQGAHILTGKELLSGYRFEDTIAASAHPVDIHCAADTSQKVIFLDQEGFIPYRSLYNDAYVNLLVAGRCISADSDAFASVRVQAPCMATGQAAGTAAALCCQNRTAVSRLDPALLQTHLKMSGAV